MIKRAIDYIGPIVKSWDRKKEPLYADSPYIAEYWNSWSNILFVIFGLLRAMEIQSYLNGNGGGHSGDAIGRQAPIVAKRMRNLWLLMACAGVCSFIHHALNVPGTIVLDWIPIASSILYLVIRNSELIRYISWAAWAGFAFASLILLVDHVHTTLPVPWGHVMWHVSIAYAIAGAYQDMMRSFPILPTACICIRHKGESKRL